MAAKKQKITGNVFVQKRNSTCEFVAWDRTKELGDFSFDLGDININDGMTKRELIEKLENALAKVKAHPGDVFVVQ